MSSVANWIAAGVHGALAVATFFLLAPGTNALEPLIAWAMLPFGYTAHVVAFVTQALHIGQWPEAPEPTATNVYRYVGKGVASLFLIGAFVVLSRGGVRQFFATVAGVLYYSAVFTFAALAFGESDAVLAFFIIASVLALSTVLIYNCHGEYGKPRLTWGVQWVCWFLEGVFIVLAGLELFDRKLLSNAAQDWAFAALSVVAGAWYLIVYLLSCKQLWISGETVTVTRSTVSSYSQMNDA